MGELIDLQTERDLRTKQHQLHLAADVNNLRAFVRAWIEHMPPEPVLFCTADVDGNGNVWEHKLPCS